MARDLKDAVEVIKDRLYWVASCSAPEDTEEVHYFSVDRELVYEPFFADFGPLNLCMVHRYCKLLERKLNDPRLSGKQIVHYCSTDAKQRANAACLICLFQVAVMSKTAEQAYLPFSNVYPPFLAFRDAACGVCTFQLTILDCLRGLEESMRLRWFDLDRFDVEAYEYFEKVENGDMSWLIPDKFLALAAPCSASTDMDGFPCCTPEDYIPIFNAAGIRLVIRLNKKQYDRTRFLKRGIKHLDLYFLDGSCPNRDIVSRFLHVTENEPGAVAVHCKAGLGRTGTLIGLYAMKHYQFPARAYIAWSRLCRPGCVLGPQQQFLVDMQTDMFQAGSAARRIPAMLPLPGMSGSREQSLSNTGQLFLKRSDQQEDVGQGERLCNAKRSIRDTRSAQA